MGLMAFVPCLRTLYLFYFIYFYLFYFFDKQHQWHQHRDQSEWTQAWTITSFKYLGSLITDEDTNPETLFRIAQTTAAFTGMN